MNSNFVGVYLFLLLGTTVATFPTATAQSCNACNCQFDNVQVLSQLIEAKVNRALANDPIVRILIIAMDGNRQMTLLSANLSTSQFTYSDLAQISLSDPTQAVTSSNNLLAYRPRFNDGSLHNSNLAGVFINLESAFSCLEQATDFRPICRAFTEDEDGFRNGKALIEMADRRTIFSSSGTTSNYGLAIQNCPEFTSECFPNHYSMSVVCYLPRATCS